MPTQFFTSGKKLDVFVDLYEYIYLLNKNTPYPIKEKPNFVLDFYYESKSQFEEEESKEETQEEKSVLRIQLELLELQFPEELAKPQINSVNFKLLESFKIGPG